MSDSNSAEWAIQCKRIALRRRISITGRVRPSVRPSVPHFLSHLVRSSRDQLVCQLVQYSIFSGFQAFQRLESMN